MKTQIDYDAIIVGAGFSGLRSLYALRQAGLKVRVIEAADEIGGVWNHNRYPGARCDVESYDYSLMVSKEIEQNWRWTERYAKQPEILSYIHYVADTLDLNKDIQLNTRLTKAQYNEQERYWQIETSSRPPITARFLILAVGQLSKIKKPNIVGESSFAGSIYHAAAWPKTPVDFTGKRVGIIGTGSSGVQMTPVIAQQADHLYVYQRTANYSIPACHAIISDEEDAAIKARYDERRAQSRNSPTGLGFLPSKLSAVDDNPENRERVFEAAWNRLGFGFALAYYDILLNEESNKLAVEFIERKIAAKVPDPVLREKLTPKGFPFGAMRPAVDHGYYEAFSRDNVSLVDIKNNPIAALDEHGVILTDGTHHAVDILIYATGFDVFTGSILDPLIIGREGKVLRDHWDKGPQNYLGMSVNGFPNLFMMAGPGSPSLLSNVIVSIEDHAEFFKDIIVYMRQHGHEEIEPTPQAEHNWVKHVNERAQETLYPKAPSYYMGAEVAGKPQVFMPYSGGVRGYRRIMQSVQDKGWDGFRLN